MKGSDYEVKNLILLAVQGAGKGTVAQELMEKHGLVHISMGDLLRKRRTKDDEIARIIAKTQDVGEFTPNEIIYQLIEERLSQKDCNNGYILDGFPRTLEQAIKCDEITKKLNKPIDGVINLVVPAEVLIDRIVNRRSCGKCNKIYNLTFKVMIPKTKGICDVCEGELVQRADDMDIDAIGQRIELYHTNAIDIISYYQELGILHEIDSIDTKLAVKAVEELLDR